MNCVLLTVLLVGSLVTEPRAISTKSPGPEAVASCTFRNGSGTNPSGYTCVTAPVIGAVWETNIDVATPGAAASIVSLSLGGTIPAISLGIGELLCAPPFLNHTAMGGTHQIAIPGDLSLVGQTFCTQGGAIAFNPVAIQLQNAIDIVVGAQPLPLSFGDSISSTLDPATEVELGQFSALAMDELFVPYTRTTGFGFSLDIRVHSPIGQTLLMSSGADGILTGVCPVDGEYTLSVGTSSGVIGSYSLTLQRLVNPGNVIAAAVFGDSLDQGNISPTTEVEVIQFTALGGDRLVVPFTRTSGFGFSLQIDLYDDVGTLLDETSGTSGIFQPPPLPGDGTYFLWAYNPDRQETGTYNLTLQRLVNPGNVIAIASFGDSLQREISPTTEIEVIQFSGLGGDRLFVPFTRTTGFGFSLQLGLFDGTGALLDSASGAAGILESTPLAADGTYYLWVYNPDQQETGNYDLSMQRLVAPGNLTPIVEGTPTSGSISPISEVDVYQFSATLGQEATIPFARTTGFGFALELRLYDETGGLLQTASGASGTLSSGPLPNDGDYFIWVRNPSLNVTGSYSLTLNLAP